MTSAPVAARFDAVTCADRLLERANNLRRFAANLSTVPETRRAELRQIADLMSEAADMMITHATRGL
jgi:hypothetical protein